MKNYESFLTACISLMHEPDKPWSRQIAVVYEHTKTTQEKCSPIGHNNAKHVPNQEPASAWIFGNSSVILGDPGAASRVGSKGATKVLKYGWKSPWPHSHRTILKNSNGCRLLIGHKKCFVLFCPIGEQFLLSSFRTRRLLSRHSCQVRSPSFPNQKQRKSWWVEKRFGCYQQEQLHWENSVSDGSRCIVNNRKFKMQRRRESKKNNGLIRQNNNFARASRFFVHFFAVNCTTTRENA